MNIVTNNRPRQLQALVDLSEDAQKEFDYIERDDEKYYPRIVQYKGAWYDVYDSQHIHKELGFDKFKGWDAIVTETFFSGVLFKFFGDDEVIVGMYYA